MSESTSGPIEPVEPAKLSDAERQQVLVSMGLLSVCRYCGALAAPLPPTVWDGSWGPVPSWSHYSVKEVLTPLCLSVMGGEAAEPVPFLQFYGLPVADNMHGVDPWAESESGMDGGADGGVTRHG